MKLCSSYRERAYSPDRPPCTQNRARDCFHLCLTMGVSAVQSTPYNSNCSERSDWRLWNRTINFVCDRYLVSGLGGGKLFRCPAECFWLSLCLVGPWTEGQNRHWQTGEKIASKVKKMGKGIVKLWKIKPANPSVKHITPLIIQKIKSYWLPVVGIFWGVSTLPFAFAPLF